jgi:hypothetical protein
MNFSTVFCYFCALCNKRQRTAGQMQLNLAVRTAKFNCIWSSQYMYVFLIFLMTNTTLYNIQRSVFLMQADSVLCEIRIEDLHKM